MKKSIYYLAYGSNLNLGQMAYRCPEAQLVGTSMLRDCKLMFRGSGSGSYLTVEPSKGDTVPLGVFKITRADEAHLDAYEGYPVFYGKQVLHDLPLFDLESKKQTGTIDGLIYTLPASHPAGFPSRRYWQTCMEGYRDLGFAYTELMLALSRTGKEIAKEVL